MPDRLLMFGQAIMHTLLEYIKKDRLADALVEKLCLRFDASGEDQSQSRNLAFCLAQASCCHTGATPSSACPSPCEECSQHATGNALRYVCNAVRGIAFVLRAAAFDLAQQTADVDAMLAPRS